MTCDEHEINEIFGWIEDQNEVLMYVGDVLAVDFLSYKIKDTIMLSLLNFAYLPKIVSSLVVIKSNSKSSEDEKLCINVSIFILIRTFKIFQSEISQKMLKIGVT